MIKNSFTVYGKNKLVSNNQITRLALYKRLLLTVLIALIAVIGFGTYASFADNGLRSMTYLFNDSTNNCLNIDNTVIKSGDAMSMASCDHSIFQNWSVQLGFIKHGNLCLTVLKSNDKGYVLTVETCSNDPSQVFLPTGNKLLNSEFGLCLAAANSSVDLEPCLKSSNNSQMWFPYSYNNKKLYKINSLNCGVHLSSGQLLACNTMVAWDNWNTKNSNHFKLLNNYTNGNSYEEWCADFVSYIYHVSNKSFVNGERNSWDEYDANNIQFQGFKIHAADSGYLPKAGDVAFFNYPGGHVEMVVVGGIRPTYIYGDSATIDSQTGNGNMAANTIQKDGQLGQVTYYLSMN